MSCCWLLWGPQTCLALNTSPHLRHWLAQIVAQSEGNADDELLSVAVLKGGSKVVCGSTSGVLNIWSWGYWNDCSDRFPGGPAAAAAAAACLSGGQPLLLQRPLTGGWLHAAAAAVAVVAAAAAAAACRLLLLLGCCHRHCMRCRGRCCCSPVAPRACQCPAVLASHPASCNSAGHRPMNCAVLPGRPPRECDICAAVRRRKRADRIL